MIIDIGCDIVDHQMTSKLNWANEPGMLSRIFSRSELDLYELKKELRFLAGRFAAKEAILKCIGTGMQDGIALTEVEILQLSNGKPTVKLGGIAKETADKAGIKSLHITISHTASCSLAYVIAEGD